MAQSHRRCWHSQVRRYFVLAVLAAVLCSRAAAEDDAEDDLDDEDFDAELPSEEAPEPVEDFDLGLSESQQKVKMNACFMMTLRRLQERRSQVQDMVKDIVAQRQIKEDQAINSILMSWVMTCYLNIEDELASTYSASTPFTEELEQASFSQKPERPQQLHQASKRQWSLLEKVALEVQEQNKDQRQQQQQKSSSQGAGSQSKPAGPGVNLPGSGMTTGGQTMYVMIVFVVLFGGAALVVTKLLGSETSSKGKKEKVEKKKKR